jgi:hypothetical protein
MNDDDDCVAMDDTDDLSTRDFVLSLIQQRMSRTLATELRRLASEFDELAVALTDAATRRQEENTIRRGIEICTTYLRRRADQLEDVVSEAVTEEASDG